MATNEQEYPVEQAAQEIVAPAKLAHFVLRTSRYQEMLAWYQEVVRAHVVFGNEFLSFLTYDDEHHRIALLAVPDLEAQREGIAGVHHIAFTYNSLHDLLENYAALKAKGVECQRRSKSRPLGGAKSGHLIRVLASAWRA